MSALDPRLNAYRSDLADSRLEGRVDAARFVPGEPAGISAPVARLRRGADTGAGVDTELIFGQSVTVFERGGGWAWAQSDFDGYVGHVREDALGEPPAAATHVVSAPRTFVYPGPDLKIPYIHCLSLGSELIVVGYVETRGTRYAELATGGHIVADHLRAADEHVSDFVAVAETLVSAPYLWAGTSAFGVDCSGLVQLSMRMTGRRVLRDTDMQQATIGSEIDGGDLQRGDLVFWDGHVAVLTDKETIIHASGKSMQVTIEPFDQAKDRIEHLYGPPTGFRRP